jgi:1-deoxy-D-xylulose-5-phosphate reductoisomerase
MTRGIAILGSTGSIGTQALEVIRSAPDRLHVEVLSAHTNSDLLIAQALEFRPNAVVIGDPAAHGRVRDALFDAGIKTYCGPESLASIVESDGIHTVLTALVGAAGLVPTLRAIRAGKQIALANKETLVVAGA